MRTFVYTSWLLGWKQNSKITLEHLATHGFVFNTASHSHPTFLYIAWLNVEQIVFFTDMTCWVSWWRWMRKWGEPMPVLKEESTNKFLPPLLPSEKNSSFDDLYQSSRKLYFFYCVCEINVMYIDEHQLHFRGIHMAIFTCMLKLIRVPCSAIFLLQTDLECLQEHLYIKRNNQIVHD